MNERIKELRKELGLSGEKFGDAIGISKASISIIEKGGTVSERTIKNLCSVFDVNENWLRTGEGSMFIEKTVNEELVSMIAEIAVDGDPFVVKTLTEMCKLSPECWEEIEKMLKRLAEED